MDHCSQQRVLQVCRRPTLRSHFRSVHTLAVNLQVSKGNADLGVVAVVHGKEVAWTSQTEGGDYLEIKRNGQKLSDGLELKRQFVVVVICF